MGRANVEGFNDAEDNGGGGGDDDDDVDDEDEEEGEGSRGQFCRVGIAPFRSPNQAVQSARGKLPPCLD